MKIILKSNENKWVEIQKTEEKDFSNLALDQ